MNYTRYCTFNNLDTIIALDLWFRPLSAIAVASSCADLFAKRTPALIALIAVSVGASCATPPALLSGGDRAEGSLSDLKAFLSHGLALPCLVNHFEGFGSAAACM